MPRQFQSWIYPLKVYPQFLQDSGPYSQEFTIFTNFRVTQVRRIFAQVRRIFAMHFKIFKISF